MKKKSIKLWEMAKKIIPGGNMLLSKRPEMFLPNKWPAYFSKAKDCYIYDLDNKRYLDMSLMGVGTNILGYANKEVDNAVIKNLKKSNVSTLNCKEEVLLCKELLKINSWAGMVRLARTGGEANAISVRIARANCKKDKDQIAICGYHGWHDWYLSANIKNKKNLDNHLLSGLSVDGVPKELRGTVHPFMFNDLESFKKLIIKQKKIGIVKMEVHRNLPPKKEFLEGLIKIVKKKKLILIFDECTSGFRETYGGIHKKYKITPDICTFGKALGNGYAITAVVGKLNIMKNSQTSFISSTFWTERSGPTAALKTLEIMRRKKTWKQISQKGIKIKKRIQILAKKYNISMQIMGNNGIPTFTFNSKNNLKYKTFITQEMLKNKILASNVIYVSIAHKKSDIEKYFYNLEKIFEKISFCENKKHRIENYLESEICHQGFQRLN
tara:strand:- start:55 stop:1374 length:1320 start_codon:yes stop_codon:yes gene_type:complete